MLLKLSWTGVDGSEGITAEESMTMAFGSGLPACGVCSSGIMIERALPTIAAMDEAGEATVNRVPAGRLDSKVKEALFPSAEGTTGMVPRSLKASPWADLENILTSSPSFQYKG